MKAKAVFTPTDEQLRRAYTLKPLAQAIIDTREAVIRAETVLMKAKAAYKDAAAVSVDVQIETLVFSNDLCKNLVASYCVYSKGADSAEPVCIFCGSSPKAP
jgi:hypothetical protein